MIEPFTRKEVNPERVKLEKVISVEEFHNKGFSTNYDNDKLKLETSIWQLTIAERKNAAIFINYTTVTPFLFMGWSFKCFYCGIYNLEIPDLLKHTLDHDVSDSSKIFQKYVHKGKRTLQVDISKLKCKICEQKFQNLDAIRKHLTNEHKVHFFQASNGMVEFNMAVVNDRFNCHICQTPFHNFSLLNNHMNCHVGKVVCETCGQSFLNQPLLKKHNEMHLAKKFTCIQCEKTFSKRSQLKYHTEILHKGRNRVVMKKCHLCTETFKEHYTKMLHLKDAHGIVKYFSCHLCDKIFSKRRLLTQHITRSHTERFKCNSCSKSFGTEGNLKMHMRGHSGEREFVCSVCNNAYVHKSALNRHIRTHQTIKCAECAEKFHDAKELIKHKALWHSDKNEQVPK